MSVHFQSDIDAVNQIPAVKTILEVVCRTTGMGFSAIARVTDTHWIACAVKDDINFGLKPGGELKLGTTICNEIRQTGREVVIDSVIDDAEFVNHHTPAMYGFQSYISMPIVRKDGTFFGTLCAIDPNPAHLKNPQITGMFKLFAELISFHLQAIEKNAETEAKLAEERQIAELREQFIAILGHDLRNPVGAVSNVAQLLLRMPLDDRTKRLAHILQDSSFRMKGLIENVLDFASGRLGDGIVLDKTENLPVEDILTKLTREVQLVWPGRQIQTTYALTEPVTADGGSIAQLYSNILSNALTYGDKEAPVKVTVSAVFGEFTLAVTNTGKKIDESKLKRLFQPFYRGDATRGQRGLGLGLYISSEIARAHGGTMSIESNDDETTFKLRMPAN